jgi:hypothetical protein
MSREMFSRQAAIHPADSRSSRFPLFGSIGLLNAFLFASDLLRRRLILCGNPNMHELTKPATLARLILIAMLEEGPVSLSKAPMASFYLH